MSTAARRFPLAAAVVVAGLAVLGVAQGLIWALIAPGEQFKVFADGGYGSLPTSDYHPFDGMAMFVLAGAAVGLVAAVALWRVRAIRGPGALGALFAGSAVGAGLAYVAASLAAHGVDPAAVGASSHASIVTAAPTLGTPLVLLAEPLAAMVVYTFLVAWDGRPDLGRNRVVDGAPIHDDVAGADGPVHAGVPVDAAGGSAGRPDPAAPHSSAASAGPDGEPVSAATRDGH